MELNQMVNSEDGKICRADIMLLLLQLNDSGFPTGAFTHSLGYESSVQRLYVHDKSSLEAFVVMTLENVGSSSLPYVRDAHQHSEELLYLRTLEEHFITTHSNHIANRASKQQGCSLLHTCVRTFDHSVHNKLQSMIDSGEMQGFQEIIFGSVYATLGLPLHTTLLSFMFSALRTVTASIVRLGRIMGTLEAQEFQFQMQKRIPSIIQRNFDRSTDDVCLKHPLPDLMQGSHDTLFSRLFYS